MSNKQNNIKIIKLEMRQHILLLIIAAIFLYYSYKLKYNRKK